MNATVHQNFTGDPRKPGLRLRKRGLIGLLLAVLSLPPLAIFTLYATLPPASEAELEVDVAVVRIPTDGGDERALRVHNRTGGPLEQMRVEINGAFYHLPVGEISSDATLNLPLRWFMKKSGHQFAESAKVEAVRINARLPNNARAFRRIAF